MPRRRPPRDPRQPDLFAARGAAPETRASGLPRLADAASPSVPPIERRPPLAERREDEVIAGLATAELREAEALCAEILRRRLRAAAPALEALWMRFRGFGRDGGLPEQRAAIVTLGALGGPGAAAALARIAAEAPPPGLLGPLLAAALRLGLRPPAARLEEAFGHPDPAVRRDACRLAGAGGPALDRLKAMLGDPDDGVRRTAAIELGLRGAAAARAELLRQLALEPDREIVEALAGAADADAWVMLGRLARARPEFLEQVLAACDDAESPAAARVAGGLRRDAGA